MDTSLMINIVIIVFAGLFFYTRFAPVKGLRNLNDADFRSAVQQSKDSLLIDVREPHEYKGGFIPGAKNIPLSQLSQRMNEIPKDRDVFLYCRSGMRSKSAAKKLGRGGYRKLAHLQGGIGAWSGKVTK
ncbi:rhodanese-like domain-containing protein [Paenibacillus alginolyticus]|uniref:rhodanese-like domain-containing protein n=1 Tax=Paenibacillus alginolyticus TaxID=59839 RepID=UPI0004165A43|nr:rhodanese-like domain-containing protein [Paenibacillus alginolyticus]MCY9667548.1 rhodanese-like domain-containing protein [Paenibacillus alginolyticus]